jgi:hypothetical protein
MANNYITQFDETLAQQEVPNRKITVVDTTIQHSVQQFLNQRNGGIQDNICYSPENLDIVRWKLGRCWNDNAGSRSELKGQWEWDPANNIGTSSTPTTVSTDEQKQIITILQDIDQSYGLKSNLSWQWSINSDLVSDESYTGITSKGETVASAFGSTNPNNVKGKMFFDHVTDLHATIDYNNINNRTFGSVKVLYHSIAPSYNFYIEDYEDALNDYGMNGQGIDEKTIPNMYAFLMVQQEKDPQDVIIKDDPSTINDIYELHVTLNGEIENELYTADSKGVPLANTVLVGSSDITKASEGQYFDKYAKSYLDFQNSGPAFDSTKNKFRNIIIPGSDLDFYKKFDSKKTQFPMHIDIEFSTDTNAELSDALMETKMSSIFIKDFLSSSASASFSIIDSSAQGQIPEPQSLNIWDVSEWFNTLEASSFQTGSADNFVFLGPFNEEIATANNDPSYDFYKTMMTIALKGKYEKILQEKSRTFDQALSGKKAYSETVFYEVEKWLADDSGNTTDSQPVQSIYFPNSTSIDVHRYVDTQVKYGQKYLYRVKAYQVIFGMQYRYDLNDINPNPTAGESNNPEGRSAELCVFTRPSVKLVEVPYFEKLVQVVDNPPIFPDVDIIPYRDERNKVLFYLRGNVGDYDMQPVSIEFADNLKIANIRESQERPAPLPINFKSDDQARTFEIFRLEEKPSSYLDFLDNKIASLDTEFTNGLEVASATSTSFVDSIESNKKYYYIFRTIDVHENVSNPTPVYEIEIIDNEGAPALVTEVYEITKGKLIPQSFTKPAKRFIHIRPSQQQLIVNEEEAGLLNEDGTAKSSIPEGLKQQETAGYLGISDNVIWNKDYKIRLTSKKTGKQIDFNIKYVTKVNRPTS